MEKSKRSYRNKNKVYKEVINIHRHTEQDVFHGYDHRDHRTHKHKKNKTTWRRNNRLERYNKKEFNRELKEWK